MASELRLTTLANNAGTESVDTTYVINGSAKAWVNFDATSSNSVRDSLNISSISDGGSGVFQVVMTNAMGNNSYSYNGFAGNYCYVTSSTSYSPTTTQFNHYAVRYNTTTYTDASGHYSQVWGDLA
jgi:hypothetical protein